MSWEIEKAPATKPGDVIDAHVHLFTLPLMMEWVERPGHARALQAGGQGRQVGRGAR